MIVMMVITHPFAHIHFAIRKSETYRGPEPKGDNAHAKDLCCAPCTARQSSMVLNADNGKCIVACLTCSRHEQPHWHL